MQHTSVSQKLFDEIFTQKKRPTKEDKQDVKENIERFIQTAHLIINNSEELQDIILAVLSKMTIVHTQDFGVECFKALRDLMVSEPELKINVRRYLNSNIILKLNSLPPKDIPVGLLDGLCTLMSDTNLNETKLMTHLFSDFFPKWLSEIKEQIVYAVNLDQNKIN